MSILQFPRVRADSQLQGFVGARLDIVVVFSSSREDVLKFIAQRPRPFRIVADPEARTHQTFGVESSLWGK